MPHSGRRYWLADVVGFDPRITKRTILVMHLARRNTGSKNGRRMVPGFCQHLLASLAGVICAVTCRLCRCLLSMRLSRKSHGEHGSASGQGESISDNKIGFHDPSELDDCETTQVANVPQLFIRTAPEFLHATTKFLLRSCASSATPRKQVYRRYALSSAAALRSGVRKCVCISNTGMRGAFPERFTVATTRPDGA